MRLLFDNLESTIMWKVLLGKSVKEVRIVVNDAVTLHPLIRFTDKKLPELRMLAPNTMFSKQHCHLEMDTPYGVAFHFGDLNATIHYVPGHGVSYDQWDEIFKEKVLFGQTLDRRPPDNNDDRQLPMDIVESIKYLHHLDDNF